MAGPNIRACTAALFWSAIWGALFLRDRRVATLAFVASLSHFVADLPAHNHDMALYPHAETHLGYGLWGKLGTASWVLTNPGRTCCTAP